MQIQRFHQYENIKEWNSVQPNRTDIPVRLFGIIEGNIDPNGNGFTDYINIEEARKDFPELHPTKGSKNFTMAMNVAGLQGHLTFSTWQHFKHNQFA
jgi:hypothetical protein